MRCHTAGMAGRRSGRVTLLLAIAAAAFISGCAGASAPASPAPSIGASVPGTASPAPSPPTASPSAPDASAPVIVDFGAVGTTPRGSRVTVHSFGPSDRLPEPPAGSDWLEADLEWCMPPDLINDVTIGNIRYELELELSDDTTIQPESAADSPDEVYASEGTVSADECVRGALVFAVPTAATPVHLLLVGQNGGMRWRLS